MTVERAFVTVLIFIFIRGSIPERSLIHVLSVVRVSVIAQLFGFIKEFTWERKLTSAKSIIRDLTRIYIFTIITKEKLYKSVHLVNNFK